MRQRGEERKRRREELKRRREEAARKAEEDRMLAEAEAEAAAQLAAEEQERQEREAAQRRREARERAIRNRKRAQTHYRLHLLLYYGMSPWQDYMYLLRLRMKKALLHYRQTLLQRCFDALSLNRMQRRHTKTIFVEQRLAFAARADRRRLLLGVFNAYRKRQWALARRAGKLRRHMCLRLLSRSWGLWIQKAARRASLRHEQRLQRARLAKLRGGRMLLVRMFRKWVVATQVLKEESRRRSRQEKIWSKVQGWFDDDDDE